MKSVLRDWVMELPLRHQGVLITALRGCDSAPKENSAKPLVRALRYAVLNPADEREVGMPSAFMSPGFSDEELRAFLKDWDHYPIHFVQHLMHACQVVGNCYPPEEKLRGPSTAGSAFLFAYHSMVHKLRLNPETPAEMHARLTEDRIARYGNATGDTVPLTGPADFDPNETVEIIVTKAPNGIFRWETGPSYLGSRVAHSDFASVSDAIDDAVDRFNPSPVAPRLREETVAASIEQPYE